VVLAVVLASSVEYTKQNRDNRMMDNTLSPGTGSIPSHFQAVLDSKPPLLCDFSSNEMCEFRSREGHNPPPPAVWFLLMVGGVRCRWGDRAPPPLCRAVARGAPEHHRAARVPPRGGARRPLPRLRFRQHHPPHRPPAHRPPPRPGPQPARGPPSVPRPSPKS